LGWSLIVESISSWVSAFVFKGRNQFFSLKNDLPGTSSTANQGFFDLPRVLNKRPGNPSGNQAGFFLHLSNSDNHGRGD
jgi:hypothetical protein